MTHHESQTTENVIIRTFPPGVTSLEQARTTAPTDRLRLSNTTRDAYHEAVIGELNGTAADIEIDALALGDSTTATSNVGKSTPLGNETFRTSVTDVFVDGRTVTASIFIDSTQGDGLVFNEAALVAERSGGDLPINRFLIDDPGGLLDPKSENETVTLDIQLTQEDA
jgi:hypothetical protein